jgi:hypothetical protein
MAERIKDAEDRLLESMFASPSIADDGFSVGIVRKLSHRLWMRRLTLPTAALIGAAISFKPLTGLFAALSSLSVLIPQDALNSATSAIPQLQIVVMGAVLLAVGLVGMRVVEN